MVRKGCGRIFQQCTAILKRHGCAVDAIAGSCADVISRNGSYGFDARIALNFVQRISAAGADAKTADAGGINFRSIGKPAHCTADVFDSGFR